MKRASGSCSIASSQATAIPCAPLKATTEDELHYGNIRYSATENAVFCGSTIVALTQTELRLLSYMMKQPEKAYSREELLSAVWGFDSDVETRVTDETLRRIRKKLTQADSTVSEEEYQNRTIPYTDDESFFDGEWNDAEEHFLMPSIVFLELDHANQSSGWNRGAYRLEKKMLEYCKGRDLLLNQCYTFKTDRHHLIFMSVQEEQDDWESHTPISCT